MKLIINTDGGARGNPGPAGAGAVVSDAQGNIITTCKQYLGKATNNQAEYKALILALGEARRISNSQSPVSSLEIKMDSELIVRQLQGRYKIKDADLKVLAAQVFRLLKYFPSVEFKHIKREQNRAADDLVNQAIDEILNKQNLRN